MRSHLLTCAAALATAMVPRGVIYAARGTPGWDDAMARLGTLSTNQRGETVLLDGVADPSEGPGQDGKLRVYRREM